MGRKYEKQKREKGGRNAKKSRTSASSPALNGGQLPFSEEKHGSATPIVGCFAREKRREGPQKEGGKSRATVFENVNKLKCTSIGEFSNYDAASTKREKKEKGV